jgi:hypothetical protein
LGGLEQLGGSDVVTRILLTLLATARSIRTFEILVEADHRTREGTEGGGRPRRLRIERKTRGSKDSMWKYGVYGIQRAVRLW